RDWSSDVCSSDLKLLRRGVLATDKRLITRPYGKLVTEALPIRLVLDTPGLHDAGVAHQPGNAPPAMRPHERVDDLLSRRRVGITGLRQFPVRDDVPDVLEVLRLLDVSPDRRDERESRTEQG